MSTRASAGRYARALLDVASSEGSHERIEKELADVAALVETNGDLKRALTNPVVPVAAKRRIVETLVSRLAPAKPLGKLLLLLVDRDRFALLGELADAYREQLMEYRQIVRAEVISAAPLTPDRAAQFEQRLAAATGRHISLTTRVDPSLIGGAVARVGTIVYDGSVATQLERLRERLTHERR